MVNSTTVMPRHYTKTFGWGLGLYTTGGNTPSMDHKIPLQVQSVILDMLKKLRVWKLMFLREDSTDVCQRKQRQLDLLCTP